METLTNETKQRLAKSLKHYRLLNRLSQAEAATLANVTKCAYLEAETGKTVPRAEWLCRLCNHYHIPLSRLFEPLDIPNVAFYTNNHKSKAEQAAQTEAIRVVNRWATDYAFLEACLNETSDPLPMPPHASPKETARFARKTLWQLGGFTPESLPSTLARYGVKVYIGNLGDSETFGFSYQAKAGGWVIAVNSGNGRVPSERQLWIAAHEFGHIMLGSAGRKHHKNSPEEVDANAFASELLMPDLAFKSRWEDCAHLPFYSRVIAVKHAFKVPAKMVLYRIAENADHLKAIMRAFNAIAKQNNTPNLRDQEPSSLNFSFESDRFLSLALKAHQKGELSTARLAELYGYSMQRVKNLLRSFKPGYTDA